MAAPAQQARDAADDRTGVLVPPPIVYALGFAIGWWADRATGFSAGVGLPLLGTLLVLLGGGIGLSALVSFRRARTTFNPAGGTTAIVAEGPYAWTRNPMYVALTLGYAGFAFILGRVGPLLALPFVLLWIDRMVIRREEAYLEHKFGEAYRRYKDRVRRWV